MRRSGVAGLLTGLAGLAVSYLVGQLLASGEWPVAAVAERIIEHAPGPLAERAIDLVGTADKPILVWGIVVVVALVAGALSRVASPWIPIAGYIVLAAVGVAAIAGQPGDAELAPLSVAAGFVTWVVVHALFRAAVEPRAPDVLHADPGVLRAERQVPGGGSGVSRRFVVTAGLVAIGTVVAAYLGRAKALGRERIENARRLLRLDGVNPPPVDPSYDSGVPGQQPWLTPVEEFYRIDTAIVPPTVDPDTWRLRVHGLVDHPLELSLDQLMMREVTEDWVTLTCVSNDVGGDLVGNAWWSGVRIAPLLEQAGIQPDADAVLQTSADGWTCVTPLAALTDGRNALLAVAQNGDPLTIEHGFPVRMVVPGLYGYVSATKWLVDLEVTRFDQAQGYWIERGWAEQGPIKLASRIDVPGVGEQVSAGKVTLAGTAWQQHTGVAGAQVSLDGGDWRDADLAATPGVDTWVQWRIEYDVEPGEHQVQVRAVSATGEVQTAVVAGSAPDGATGWHTITFRAG
ncbi:MAG: molybdopterin-dependent oxidoreductase [Nocardioides sp.]